MSESRSTQENADDGPLLPSAPPPPTTPPPPADLTPEAPVAVPEESDPDLVTSDTGDETDKDLARTGQVPSDDRSDKSDDRSSGGSVEEDKGPGLHLNMPERRGFLPSVSEENDPRTPAEKVRFILSDNGGAGLTPDGEELSLDVHALFCQMDILCHFDDGETGWKESARWLKYEEKVEAGERWSKPHVPTASLHALHEIRKGFDESVTLLDLDAPHGCLHQVAEKLTDAIMTQKELPEEKRRLLLDVLVQPHKHKHRKAHKNKLRPHDHAHGTSLTSTPKKGNTLERGASLDRNASLGRSGDKAEESVEADDTMDKKGLKKLFSKVRLMPHSPDEKEVSALNRSYPGGVLPEDLKPYKSNKRLLRKIPGGSEAANILVGQVSFLDDPVMLFARLNKSAVLADLTEVALPTRFIFLVLGPPESTSIWEYEEVGRAMGALLTDRVFCEVAYKANTSQDLLDGLDEFIDDLTVLPPSIWDPSTRLEPPETTMSIDKIRNRLLDSARHAAGEQAFHFAESAGEDETLKRTGRLFGGMLMDIKRRYRWYWSDIRDGLHMQCLASVIFLYFACITPIVTFGGLLGHATTGYMGTMETILSGALCGIVFALFAGQPLTIVGATGPMLIFESILYHFCEDHQLSFLPFRFWIGIWVAIILIVIVAFDLSALVKYITRFTEESFAVLISLIFIFEAFKKLAHVWDTHPIHIHAVDEDVQYKCHCEHPPEVNFTSANLSAIVAPPVLLESDAGNGTGIGYDSVRDHPIFETFNWTSLVYEDCITYQNRLVVGASCIEESDCLEHSWILVGPACNVYTVTHSVPDVFFFCCFLFIGTFVIAFFFRNFRAARFFPAIVRSTLSDFAVLVAILLCTAADFLLALDTPKLSVPSEFKNTREDRGWIINPLNLQKYWLIPAAILPAILATILIFLDQQITAVIINRKEHKLQKGHGYHLDLFVLALLIAVCSAMGLPWFVAATVRSVTHVRSLIRESELRAPGERSQFLGVREQRVTALIVHILIGVSVLLTSVLQHVPMAVLYGVFFYMGVTSLSGVQFVQRILILFMPEKYQPDYIYLRHLNTSRVHIFTVIQIVCMSIMWVFKSIKVIAILFPIMILGLCFVRKAMDYFFSQHEMYWLDHILPDEHRRKKEDEALEAGEVTEITDDMEKTMEPPAYAEPEAMPLTGPWDQHVAKRDYGVGRKLRPRTLSANVIQRYKRQQGNRAGVDDALEEVDEETSDSDDAQGPRKLSANVIQRYKRQQGFRPRIDGVLEEADEEASDSDDALVYGPAPFRERKFSL